MEIPDKTLIQLAHDGIDALPECRMADDVKGEIAAACRLDLPFAAVRFEPVMHEARRYESALRPRMGADSRARRCVGGNLRLKIRLGLWYGSHCQLKTSEGFREPKNQVGSL